MGNRSTLDEVLAAEPCPACVSAGREKCPIHGREDPPAEAPLFDAPVRDAIERIARRERTTIDVAQAEGAVRLLLASFGIDWTQPEWKDTPERVARMYRELFEHDQDFTLTTFADIDGVRHAGEMIVVSGIKTWSLCSHHLLPFECDVAVGYIPADSVLGLSKLPRIARAAASRVPTMQEQVVADIADALMAAAASPDVAVTARGAHLCMRMRGVKAEDSVTTTTVVRGRFFASAETRQEFFEAARR